jgi:hypothetical protein
MSLSDIGRVNVRAILTALRDLMDNEKILEVAEGGTMIP